MKNLIQHQMLLNFIKTVSERIAIARDVGNSKDDDKGYNYMGKSEAEADNTTSSFKRRKNNANGK